ncbi:MAG: nucleoside diphosphate kinase regulator [Luteimonas sp.]
MSSQPQSGLPPSPHPVIRLRSRDLARLDALLDTPIYRQHPGAPALQRELDRADLVPDDAPGEAVVGLHARVRCIDDTTGAHHDLTLVLPHEADVDAGRVSVLAPVGTALLGLTRGQRIDWPAAGDRVLRLRVLDITPAA